METKNLLKNTGQVARANSVCSKIDQVDFKNFGVFCQALVIETKVQDKADEYLKLHRAIGSIGVGVDVLVMSGEEFARRSQVPGTLPYWAAKEGRLIHDASA